jgi:hypothetical protein
MPQTFSPTVKSLNFAFMMQIAVTLDCICTEFGIRDIFFVGIRDIMLDIEKYEFLVLGIKYLIILEIISLLP